MKVLVIGGGGREHAIAWKLARAGHEVIGAPGNPGIAREGRVFATDRYLDLAREQQVALTVVGPEAPLAAGLADEFRAAGLPIVGPTRAGARLEASKVYAKAFMERVGIPTARAVRAESAAAARDALRSFPLPVVIKADGLAAGKGVIIAETAAEAEAAAEQLGPRLVIEEFLAGEEVSFIALCDGKHVLPLEATQDHKRIFDGDAGPNTGGMGAYCDGRILTAAEADRIVDLVMEPAVAATGFTGFLYAGLMMTQEGPKVLEFNVRLGDPEAQVLLHRLDADPAEAFEASTRGALRGVRLRWKPDPSVCVVMSAAGYPGTPRTGDRITGIDEAPGVVFQAGTRQTEQGLVTAGGRVLGVTASGATLPLAIDAAYRAVEKIHFEGMHYRRDIGRKGLARW